MVTSHYLFFNFICFYLKMLGDDKENVELYFDVDPSVSEVVVEASGNCGNLSLKAINGKTSTLLKRFTCFLYSLAFTFVIILFNL